MSISAIANSPLYSNSVVQSSAPQPAQLPETEAPNTEDTVQLSQLAQVQQMAQQGESPSAIAGNMGLPVSQVDSDLGISTTSSSVPVATLGGHGGGESAASASASDAGESTAATTDTSQASTPTPAVSVRA